MKFHIYVEMFGKGVSRFMRKIADVDDPHTAFRIAWETAGKLEEAVEIYAEIEPNFLQHIATIEPVRAVPRRGKHE